MGFLTSIQVKLYSHSELTKSYNILNIVGQSNFNANDGNIYFVGGGIKNGSNAFTYGIFKLDLTTDEITVIDSNLFLLHHGY